VMPWASFVRDLRFRLRSVSEIASFMASLMRRRTLPPCRRRCARPSDDLHQARDRAEEADLVGIQDRVNETSGRSMPSRSRLMPRARRSRRCAAG
jgi:hypothetical protein